ncbi:MAG: hypothetical protein MHMPM18_003947 [Marteilia pararefringens]
MLNHHQLKKIQCLSLEREKLQIILVGGRICLIGEMMITMIIIVKELLMLPKEAPLIEMRITPEVEDHQEMSTEARTADDE